jgi:pilus assembly protein Flp/PilA
VTQQELLTQLQLHPPCGRGPEEGGLDAIRRSLRMLGANERGATAIEYGLIAALIVMAMMAGLGSLGGGVHSTWGNMANKIENAS